MKKIARKEMSAEKSGRRQTGGGPPPPKPSETTEWLNSIMKESISGLPALYDSDVLDDSLDNKNATSASMILDALEDGNLCEKKNENTVDMSFEVQDIEALNNVEPDKRKCYDNIVFDMSTPHSLLRKPVSKQLCNSFKNKKKAFTPLETRKQLITHFDSKIKYISKKMAREEEFKKNVQEEHMQNLQEKRDMHQKVLAQMDEKHDLFIKQQKELHAMEVDFKRKMYALLLEKGNLETNKNIFS